MQPFRKEGISTRTDLLMNLHPLANLAFLPGRNDQHTVFDVDGFNLRRELERVSILRRFKELLHHPIECRRRNGQGAQLACCRLEPNEPVARFDRPVELQ